MFEFKQQCGNKSLNLFLRLSKANSTPGDSHLTARKTELAPLCMFPLDIFLRGIPWGQECVSLFDISG